MGQGKFRLIMDLSFLPASSINDDIHQELCSLMYTTMEEVTAPLARV